MALPDMINVFDFDQACKQRIARDAYDFVSGGAEDESTVKRNREGFSRITFRKRLLADVSKLDLSVNLLGVNAAMPIFIAPTGTQGRVHPEAEPAVMRAAGQVKTLMVVSNTSSMPLDQIAKAATGFWWFQLYPGPDEPATREKTERAVDLGAKAVCLTADAPYFPHRERDLRNGLVRQEVTNEVRARRRNPDEPSLEQYGLPPRFTAQLTWRFVGELCKYARVPVLVKGVTTATDAKLAMEHGAAGVVVSNHGGRYLDGDPATIDVLPEIATAIGNRGVVLMDGGIRRGTDVLKALALGARAVLVGRPPLWGLGAFGQPGVVRVMQMLQQELALAMALCGRPTLASIDRSAVALDHEATR